MQTGSYLVLRTVYWALVMAAAALLMSLDATTSAAQGPAVDGNEDLTFSARYEAALLTHPAPSPLDILALSPGSDVAAAPQGQEAGESENGAVTPSPAPEEHQRLKVNPLTGLVSDTNASYVPLTGAERWRLYWKMNYFSVGAYFGPFFSALLLDQTTNSPEQWGGGFPGYGRRVASRTAGAILQGTFQAPVAYVLHEDVRYIASKQPGFKHRAVHALVYSFLTYNNSGHPTLNAANLGGYYASTAVSTAWLPGHYKVLSYTLSNSTEQIGLTLPVNVLQEFWPEITRKLHRR